MARDECVFAGRASSAWHVEANTQISNAEETERRGRGRAQQHIENTGTSESFARASQGVAGRAAVADEMLRVGRLKLGWNRKRATRGRRLNMRKR